MKNLIINFIRSISMIILCTALVLQIRGMQKVEAQQCVRAVPEVGNFQFPAGCTKIEVVLPPSSSGGWDYCALQNLHLQTDDDHTSFTYQTFKCNADPNDRSWCFNLRSCNEILQSAHGSVLCLSWGL